IRSSPGPGAGADVPCVPAPPVGPPLAPPPELPARPAPPSFPTTPPTPPPPPAGEPPPAVPPAAGPAPPPPPRPPLPPAPPPRPARAPATSSACPRHQYAIDSGIAGRGSRTVRSRAGEGRRGLASETRHQPDRQEEPAHREPTQRLDRHGQLIGRA